MKKISKLALIAILSVSPLFSDGLGNTTTDNPLVTFDQLIDLIGEQDMRTFRFMANNMNETQLDNIYANIQNEMKEDSRDLELYREILRKRLITPKSPKHEPLIEQIMVLQNRVRMYQRKLLFLGTSKKK